MNHQIRDTPERRQTVRRESDEIPKNCQEWIRNGVVAGVKEGVEAGLKSVFADEEFCKKFWEHGHQVFVNKTTLGVHLWFGKRFLQWLTAALIAAAGALLAWKAGFTK